MNPSILFFSRLDPTQLLISLGASLSITDRNRNTALHRAVMAKNVTAVTLLLKNGANSNLKNIAGDTPVELSLKFNAKFIYTIFSENTKQQEAKKPLARFRLLPTNIIVRIPSFRDPKFRYFVMASTPFILFYLFGKICDLSLMHSTKAFLLIVLALFLYLLIHYIFDNKQLNVLAISLYLSTKFWLYVTFFEYFIFGN